MNFNEKCYEILNQVPKGKVVTYKSIAEALGTKAYRAVGNAMKSNKFPEKIPCFKVVKSDGSVGGYNGSNSKNKSRKIEKLKSDGIEVKNNKIDLDKFGYKL